MSELVRFGVSLDAALLGSFDDLCARRGYASRSEALRDMIRQELLQEHSRHDDHPATGVFSMVYDHHQPELSQQLTSQQHDAPSCIVATLHVHLDHDNCLEILVLRGMAGEISRLAERLRAIRGVKYGSFTFTSGDVLP